MDFIKKHYRGLVLSFLIGVLMPAALGPTIQANVSSDNVFEGTQSVEEVIIQYHLIANSYVNMYLELVTNENYQDYDATAFVSEEDCSDGNVTTYCLAVIMNDLLVDFEEKLRSMENSFDVYSEDSGSPTSVTQAVTQAIGERDRINSEIEAARDTLDLTLSVYNQVQTVYPMHKEMADLITNLEQYRDNLAAVRSQLELYPSRFNNATSPTCK